MTNSLTFLTAIEGNMFSYMFVIKALIAITLLGITLPLIGVNVVSKRISNIGDTISHTSLCGIGIALVSNVLPIYFAILVSVIGGILIELIRNKFNKYAEISLTIIMSLAIGITSLLSQHTSSSRFESFLFGSILTVSWTDIYILIALFIIIGVCFFMFYRTNLYITFSPTEAKIASIKVTLVNMINMVLISATIAIAASIVGSLLTTSLLVIPVACSMQLVKSYKLTFVASIIVSVATSIIAFVISIYTDLHTGGTIVLFQILILFICFLVKFIKNKYYKKKG